jgi:hypothetical protein
VTNPAGEAASVAGPLAHGAQEAALELIDVLFGWIVPIITLIIGYLMSASIGLSGAIGTLIDGVLGAAGVSMKVMAYVSVAVAVLIWGAIAGAMWSVAKRFDGKWASYILKPLATLFAGFAIGEIPAGFEGKVNNGALGALASSENLLQR